MFRFISVYIAEYFFVYTACVVPLLVRTFVPVRIQQLLETITHIT
jgi:hypothetical protein